MVFRLMNQYQDIDSPKEDHRRVGVILRSLAGRFARHFEIRAELLKFTACGEGLMRFN